MIKVGRVTEFLALLLALVFIIPTIVVIGSSFTSGELLRFPPDGFSWRWYDEVLKDPALADAFRNSFVVGVLAAFIAMAAGISLAVAAARGRGIPRGFVTALALTPLVVPLVVAAIGFYFVYVRIGLTGNIAGMAIAHAVLGVPYVFINVLAALTGLSPTVEEAARIAGASQFRTLVRVTLPLVAPSAAIGGVLAFISSWEELIVSLFLVTPDFKTVPVVLWGEIKEGISPSTSAVATIVTLLSILASLLIALVPWLRAKIRAATTKNGVHDDRYSRDGL
ncbi:ABC transporter permease [Streptomyces sp. NPDC055078]